MNEIRSFAREHHFLSNFFPSPLQYGAIAYPTVEHAFQAAKALTIPQKLKIAQASTPGLAKRLGRSVDLQPNWEQNKERIMAEILAIKFSPQTDLAWRLLATGDAYLVEGNHWCDQIWGDCNCPRHADIPGSNKLGTILMSIRDNIKPR